MNYPIIRTENPTGTTYVYECKRGVVYNITRGETYTLPAGLKVTITYQDNDGNSTLKYLNLDYLVERGDDCTPTDTTSKASGFDSETITNKLVTMQQEELVQKLEQGQSLDDAYNNIPNYFKWKENGKDIVDCNNGGMKIVSVSPSLYINKGNLATVIKDVAQQEVNAVVAKYNDLAKANWKATVEESNSK